MALPAAIFHLRTYRRNLAMARERFGAMEFSGDDRLLVLAPHCDDETLGVGGIIASARAAGAAVHVVFLTNGDNSFSTRVSEDVRFLRRNSFRQLVEIRQREALAALAALGVDAQDVTFLGYPDGGTRAMWENHWLPAKLYRSSSTRVDKVPYENARTKDAPYCGEQVLRDVLGVMAEFRPTAIFTTHPGDTHPDHWAAYAYANAALQLLRLDDGAGDWARNTELLTFMVHYGLWPTPHGYHPNAELSPPAALKECGTRWLDVPLPEHVQATKKAALECYVSQLVFTPHYLRSFLRRNESLGIIPETRLHESFAVLNGAPARDTPPVVRDPVADSMLRGIVPSADLKCLTVARNAKPGTITLCLELAQKPSSRLTYVVDMRVITRSEEDKSARINLETLTLRVQASKREVQAQLHCEQENSSRRLNACSQANGFEVDVPLDELCSGVPQTLLISASTRLGRRTLDGTELGTVLLCNAE